MPASITVSPATLTLAAVGESGQLTATVVDQEGSAMGGEVVSWSSSAASIASVSTAGRVSAVADGDATITATAGTVSGMAFVSVVIAPVVLGADDNCRDFSDDDVPTFADAALEAKVRATLGIGASDSLSCGLLSSLTEMSSAASGITSLAGIQNLHGLTFLNLSGNSIVDLTPLAGLTSLTELDLGRNSITDLTGLGSLTGLTHLWLYQNDVADLSPIGTLTQLRVLDLYINSVVDLGPLSAMTRMEEMELDRNAITSIEALAGFTSLTFLDLKENNVSDLTPLNGLVSLIEVDLADNALTTLEGMAGATSLEQVWVPNNMITEIGALIGLEALTDVDLFSNPGLTNIQALLLNPGIGGGDRVGLHTTGVSCLDVSELEAKGVTVTSGC